LLPVFLIIAVVVHFCEYKKGSRRILKPPWNPGRTLLLREQGCQNRSEAIRDLIRDSLVQEEWKSGQETVGTIAIVYDHHTRELSKILTGLQHNFFKFIISTIHVHLDAHHCMEVLIVKGKSDDLRKISDRLIGIKGVKHGRLCLTTTGKGLR
jgi:CopG family nickel-responsive transcriptional regulator